MTNRTRVTTGPTGDRSGACSTEQCTIAGTTSLGGGQTRLDVARFTWPS